MLKVPSLLQLCCLSFCTAAEYVAEYAAECPAECAAEYAAENAAECAAECVAECTVAVVVLPGSSRWLMNYRELAKLYLISHNKPPSTPM